MGRGKSERLSRAKQSSWQDRTVKSFETKADDRSCLAWADFAASAGLTGPARRGGADSTVLSSKSAVTIPCVSLADLKPSARHMYGNVPKLRQPADV